jgi:hypothetical protein
MSVGTDLLGVGSGGGAAALPGVMGAGSIGLPFMAAGLIGGGISNYFASQDMKGATQASKNIIALEQQQNDLKWQQAQVGLRRASLQNFRNAQQMRSQALVSATNQGAQFGSGLQGGMGQIGAEYMENEGALQMSYTFGQKDYDINKSIGAQKTAMADYESKAATAQGYGSLFSGIFSMGNSIGSAKMNPSGGLQLS